MLLSLCRKWASSSGFRWELQRSEATLGVCCPHAHRPLLFCPPTDFQYASCHWRGCSGTQQCCGSLVSVRHCVIYTQKNQVKSSTSVWNKHVNLIERHLKTFFLTSNQHDVFLHYQMEDAQMKKSSTLKRNTVNQLLPQGKTLKCWAFCKNSRVLLWILKEHRAILVSFCCRSKQ